EQPERTTGGVTCGRVPRGFLADDPLSGRPHVAGGPAIRLERTLDRGDRVTTSTATATADVGHLVQLDSLSALDDGGVTVLRVLVGSRGGWLLLDRHHRGLGGSFVLRLVRLGLLLPLVLVHLAASLKRLL